MDVSKEVKRQHNDQNCIEDLEGIIRVAAMATRDLDTILLHLDRQHKETYTAQLDQAIEHMKSMHAAVDGLWSDFRNVIELNNGFNTLKKEQNT